MAGRKRKDFSPFQGTTIEQWQASEPLVAWARSSPEFGQVLAVVNNGMFAIAPELFAGYRAAMNQLLALRLRPTEPKQAPPANYSEPLEGMSETNLVED